MCERKSYVIKRIRDEKKIADFLSFSDEDFIPILSQRIDIESYVKKIIKYAQVYCIISENQILGMCAIYLNNGIEGFITSFNISKQFQNQGYGKLLLERVLHEAKLQNYKTVTLEVDKNNNNAIAFYKKFAFKIERAYENWLVLKVDFSV